MSGIIASAQMMNQGLLNSVQVTGGASGTTEGYRYYRPATGGFGSVNVADWSLGAGGVDNTGHVEALYAYRDAGLNYHTELQLLGDCRGFWPSRVNIDGTNYTFGTVTYSAAQNLTYAEFSGNHGVIIASGVTRTVKLFA